MGSANALLAWRTTTTPCFLGKSDTGRQTGLKFTAENMSVF